MTEITELKRRILNLLKEDLEFRYAVAGLIGMEEILKKLDRHSEELARLREDMNEVFKEIAKLRADTNKGFAELTKLREDMNRGFERYDAELTKLREDMNRGFERYDAELARLREDMNKGFARYDAELVRLREDMNKGFELVERHISALGARWGLLTEKAFREGLKGLLEKEFGLIIEKWEYFDEKGLVHGYPSQVEVDVAVKDGKTILVEVTSHARASDVFAFKRKAEFYEKITGKSPSRLLLVTPYADERAKEASRRMKIEIYTGL